MAEGTPHPIHTQSAGGSSSSASPAVRTDSASSKTHTAISDSTQAAPSAEHDGWTAAQHDSYSAQQGWRSLNDKTNLKDAQHVVDTVFPNCTINSAAEVKSTEQLGAEIGAAMKSHNFGPAMTDLQSAALDAYRRGGNAGVEALRMSINLESNHEGAQARFEVGSGLLQTRVAEGPTGDEFMHAEVLRRFSKQPFDNHSGKELAKPLGADLPRSKPAALKQATDEMVHAIVDPPLDEHGKPADDALAWPQATAAKMQATLNKGDVQLQDLIDSINKALPESDRPINADAITDNFSGGKNYIQVNPGVGGFGLEAKMNKKGFWDVKHNGVQIRGDGGDESESDTTGSDHADTVASKIPSDKQIADDFLNAWHNGDFTEFNKELTTKVNDEYKRGGMSGVEDLENRLHYQSDIGSKKIIFKDEGDAIGVHYGARLPEDDDRHHGISDHGHKYRQVDSPFSISKPKADAEQLQGSANQVMDAILNPQGENGAPATAQDRATHLSERMQDALNRGVPIDKLVDRVNHALKNKSALYCSDSALTVDSTDGKVTITMQNDRIAGCTLDAKYDGTTFSVNPQERPDAYVGAR